MKESIQAMLNPLPPSRWTERAAAHLLARAGFGGPPAQVRALHALGLERAVERVLTFPDDDPLPAPDWTRETASDRTQRLGTLQALNREYRNATPDRRKELDEKRRELQRQERREQERRLTELRSWWVRRMAGPGHPLQEKLTLFWHGHFATSITKVRDASLMWRQNQLFRQYGAGAWPELLERVARDPAMLIWLDGAQSRREHPNENLARELMELFALGEGHYSEKDVTETARALTGWSLSRETYEFAPRPRWHDDGTKTVLGTTANLDAPAVVRLIANHPQSSRHVCDRLWRFFASDRSDPQAVEGLAQTFDQSERHIAPVLRELFRSEVFYSPSVVGQQVKSPVQWLVGSLKLLDRAVPPPPMVSMALRTLGQELFAPPNVKGWDGGIAWITTNNLLNRYHLAAFLVTGENPLGASPGGQAMPAPSAPRRPRQRSSRLAAVAIDPDPLIPPLARNSRTTLVEALENRFLLVPLRDAQRKVLADYLAGQSGLDANDLREAIRLTLSTPEYQMT